jgi:hypothetical protein
VSRVLLFLAILAATLALPSAAGGSAAAPLRVLFVGNSLTAANDLPAMVAALGARAGTPIVYETRTPGGYSLEDHWRLTDVADTIASGHWDWVVLQQGPTSLPESGENLRVYARAFAVAIRAAGGRPAIYMVWPEQYRLPVFDQVIANHMLAARDSGSVILPAGLAWWKALQAHPSFPLYSRDRFHPNRLGSYLAAITIFARISGHTPIGLPRLGIREKNAKIAQRAAAAALRAAR